MNFSSKSKVFHRMFDLNFNAFCMRGKKRSFAATDIIKRKLNFSFWQYQSKNNVEKNVSLGFWMVFLCSSENICDFYSNLLKLILLRKCIYIWLACMFTNSYASKLINIKGNKSLSGTLHWHYLKKCFAIIYYPFRVGYIFLLLFWELLLV